MDHTGLLKRALIITWRYRPLWVFGFLLALCGGGSGGGGNFRFPSGGSNNGDFGEFDGLPGGLNIDESTIIALIIALFCLVILLTIVSILILVVSRTALIGMVRQIVETESVTVADGWRLGWSKEAWRVFLIGLVIGIPVAIVSLGLIIGALSPLLLIITEETVLIIIGVLLAIFAVLIVVLILILIGAIISPIQELAWRKTVLDNQGVIASLSETIRLIRNNLKDVFVVWLLMFGVGLGWGVVSLIVLLPISLITAALIGGIPALVVYLISSSVLGAAITGVPLALLTLIVVMSAVSGLYLTFQSSVWTLLYLEIQPELAGGEPESTENDGEAPDDPESPPLSTNLQSET